MEIEREMLVVDDKKTNRRLIKEIFKDEFSVLEASDRDEAMQLLCRPKSHIRIVILDIKISATNGFAFLEAKQSDPQLRRIPVIVMSETNRDADEERALDLGAADFIMRPFNSRIVKRRVENALAAESRPAKKDSDTLRSEMWEFICAKMNGGVIGSILRPGYPIYYASPSMIATLGFSGYSELYNAFEGLWANAIEASQFAKTEEELRKQLAGGETVDFSVRMKKRDGSYVLIRQTGVRIGVVDGMDMIAALCYDMTDYERGVNMQRVFEDAFDAAAEQSRDIVVRYDIPERTAYFRPRGAYELTVPMKLPDMPMSIMEMGVVGENSLLDFLRIFTSLGEAPNGTGSFMLRSKTRGGYIPYEYAYSVVHDEAKQPVNAVFTIKTK